MFFYATGLLTVLLVNDDTSTLLFSWFLKIVSVWMSVCVCALAEEATKSKGGHFDKPK